MYSIRSPNFSSFSICLPTEVPILTLSSCISGQLLTVQALYTTNVVTTRLLPTITATPTIGPFEVDGKKDCYWNPDNGDLSCVKKGFCEKCVNGQCGGEHQAMAIHDHGNPQVFCEYSSKGAGAAETAGVCAW